LPGGTEKTPEKSVQFKLGTEYQALLLQPPCLVTNFELGTVSGYRLCWG